MNIAAHIVADAKTFARTCLGLGYDTDNIKRGLVSEFSLTPAEADALVERISLKED